jgi:putative membrane protein
MKNYLNLISRLSVVAVVATSLGLVAIANAADETSPSPGMKMGMNGKSKLSAADKRFVKKAYKGGMEEVANAKMAKEKAQNDATKEVADRMITDHTKANDQLMDIAKEENLNLSNVTPKPMDISGDNFDRQYLMMLKKDHQKDIAMFEKEANDTGAKEDNDVIKFAKNTLPTLKEHLQMVEDALKKVENK